VIWVAVGGRGTLVGAAIGAVLIAALKTVLTGLYPEAWLFVLGGIFVLVTILMPRGVLGVWDNIVDGMWRTRGLDPSVRRLKA